tara:strand:- start:405 stop:509 length:105 start_codon:yes stop_codon:yes gene_type:complete
MLNIYLESSIEFYLKRSSKKTLKKDKKCLAMPQN